MNYVFDIGGMSTKYEIYDKKTKVKEGNVVYKKFIDEKEIQAIINQIIVENKTDFKVGAIAISSPGIINPETGEISGLAAIENYHLVNWKKELSKWTDKVYVENDANCAALAELFSGNAQKVNNAIFLIVGTGIGGSVIINKKLFRGSHLQAGEIGCNLEFIENKEFKNSSTQCSTNALINFYEKLTKNKITGEEILEKYHEDGNAKKAVDQMVFNLSKLIMNSSFLIDPQLVLIGGGISKNNLFIALLIKQIDELYKLTELKRQFEIKSCYYYNEANLIGALSLIEEK
ncbi:ROK family protein [Spiroplasma alleghenense]|uniref:ROK family sugar kinase n=1 Tax=Spiroplasma alleghenense TaxID=216931 RepID=A0A345Z2I6_9MOLU|nr:ROK family protein [Spiroplasma alleghenense]AXK50815.1 ROK family sugar kinase [Spiroplasma alleghenense]